MLILIVDDLKGSARFRWNNYADKQEKEKF